MSLKFLNKSQISGNQQSNPWARFPAHAQSMASAPQTSQPILIHEANGKTSWALHHMGSWRKLAPFKDHKTGAVSWRMDGTQVSNPVAWSLPRKK
jgi:hypothetical protein